MSEELLGDHCPYCDDPTFNTRPLTVEGMAVASCHDPNCDGSHEGEPIVFEPTCHPHAGSYVWYCKKHFCLTVYCAECDQMGPVFLIFKESWNSVNEVRKLNERLAEREEQLKTALVKLKDLVSMQAAEAAGPSHTHRRKPS